MKPNHIRVISVAIVAVFVIAIIQLIGGVLSDTSTDPQKTEASFNTLMVKISNAASQHEPGSPEFSSEFIQIVTTTPDIVDIDLTLNGVQLYNYPAPELEKLSDRILHYNGTSRTAQGRTLAVTVGLYASKPFSIYYRARTSFLLILAGTIAAVILIMYVRLEGMTEQTNENVIFIDETDSSVAEEKQPENEALDEHAEGNEEPVQEECEDESFIPKEEQEADDYTEENMSIPEKTPLAYSEEAQEITDETASVSSEARESELATEKEEIEEGAEETDTSFESALAENLKIAHEASTDISIFIIHSITDTPDYTAIKTLLEEKMGEAGTLFDYNNALAALIRNTDLDTALAIAEAIHKQFQKTPCVFGIAARTGRDITAQRLIHEAEQAAEHANENAPVIAFRVDPEKYKKFVEEQA